MPTLSPSALTKLTAHGRAFAWMLLAAAALYAHGMLPSWLFNENFHPNLPIATLALSFYLLSGMLVWACQQWFDPWLVRRFASSLAARLVFGGLLFAAGMEMLVYVLYLRLFPLWLGREVNPPGLYQIVYKASMAALLIYGWLLFARSTASSRLQAMQLAEETSALSTALQRAELALLEAQIEPHFLFNTLALIKRQYRLDFAEADKIMAALLHYLEQAGPALRQADWNLQQELSLVQHYLDILRYRFGPRLQYTISLPEAYFQVRIPALVLATLVENAVRHGLSPKTEGGTINIAVTPQADYLQIDINDDGVGLRSSSGSGLGLSTVRARLRSSCGASAQLQVAPGHTGGVCASVRLPLKQASDAH
jgi:sensor histidine kinase YesM